MTDGPLKHATESGLITGNLEGVVKQEFITYRVLDGMLRKETVKRRYFGSDYHDSTTTEPLMKVV
jgi:hypothetical protein